MYRLAIWCNSGVNHRHELFERSLIPATHSMSSCVTRSTEGVITAALRRRYHRWKANGFLPEYPTLAVDFSLFERDFSRA
jgi:hypothetical protein